MNMSDERKLIKTENDDQESKISDVENNSSHSVDKNETMRALKSDHTDSDNTESFAEISIRRSVSRQQDLMQSVVIKNILKQVIATYHDLDELSNALIHRKSWWSKLTEANRKYIDLFEEMLSEVHSIYQSKLKVLNIILSIFVVIIHK